MISRLLIANVGLAIGPWHRVFVISVFLKLEIAMISETTVVQITHTHTHTYIYIYIYMYIYMRCHHRKGKVNIRNIYLLLPS
jgi:hypothetical protein